MFFKKVEQQLQSNDSGICAVKIICDIYGRQITRAYITQSIKINKKGVDLIAVKSFLERNDFCAQFKLLNNPDLEFEKSDFPFILPIKSQKKQQYLVVNGLKKNKFKVYDPENGSVYNSTFKELQSKALFLESDQNLIKKEETLMALCAQDIHQYQIKINAVLKENNIAEVSNKLSYFKYIKQHFGFKNFIAEKYFLNDLLLNQEIAQLPKKFKTLYYDQGKIKIKAPTILVVKPKDGTKITSTKGSGKSVYWQLFNQLKEQKKLWYIYIFASFFSASIAQLSVFSNQVLIDHVLPSFNLGVLMLFAIGLGVYKLFDIFTTAYKRFVGVHLKNKLDQFFLHEFDSKINNFSLKYIQSYKKGDLIERVSDAMKLKRFFTKFFVSVLIDVVISFYSLVILFFINWQLALLILFTMVAFYCWFRLITPFLKHNEKIRFVLKATFLSKIIEKIEGIQVAKSFGIEQNLSFKINKSVDKYLKIQLKNEYLNLLNTTVVSLVIGAMSIAIILGLSKTAISTKSISLGQIITFIALSSKIFSSFKSILNQNLVLQENQIILKRFLDFDEKAIKVNSKNKIQDFTIKTLELKKLNYSYDYGKNILNDINFLCERGEKIKVEGKNGSGKSTLSKVMTALYIPNKGNVLINGIESHFYEENALKKKIVLTTNEDILFNESLFENICFGKDIDVSKIINLSKKIGFYDFIASKQDGLEFMIAPGGKNLSTGQRKKIILLRAFFSEAEIIILDEVLSGIDMESRSNIEKLIDLDKRTFIIISHEPIEDINFKKKHTLQNGKLNIV